MHAEKENFFFSFYSFIYHSLPVENNRKPSSNPLLLVRVMSLETMAPLWWVFIPCQFDTSLDIYRMST